MIDSLNYLHCYVMAAKATMLDFNTKLLRLPGHNYYDDPLPKHWLQLLKVRGGTTCVTKCWLSVPFFAIAPIQKGARWLSISWRMSYLLWLKVVLLIKFCVPFFKYQIVATDLGYVLSFAPVLLKMWRVYYIFHKPRPGKKVYDFVHVQYIQLKSRLVSMHLLYAVGGLLKV